VQGDGIDAVEQVVPEAALVNEFLDILVRGSDNTDVGLERTRAADGAVLATIQEAQQTHLHRTRHLAQFIQEERASFGGGDESRFCGGRAGNEPFFVAEEFRSQQFRGSQLRSSRRENGPLARRLRSWSSRAAISLSEPVSP